MPSGDELAAKAKQASDMNETASLWFDAASQYAKEGNSAESLKANHEFVEAIKKIPTNSLIEFFWQLQDEAETTEAEANASDHAEGIGGSTELFDKASQIRRKAVTWMVEVAIRGIDSKDYDGAANAYADAAKEQNKVADDLEKAAAREPSKEKKEADALSGQALIARQFADQLYQLAKDYRQKAKESK